MSAKREDAARPTSRTTESDPRQEGASTPARIAAIGAVLAAFVIAVVLLFGGDNGYEYTLQFETGGQIVPGNEVLVAGEPVGIVDEIDLTDDSQAAVRVTMDEPLREGTQAVIRQTSLSGVANRFVALTPGPNNMDELEEGTTIGGTDTTAPVDIDQLFNVFGDRERRALQKFIEGNATVYVGKQRLANRAYKFLNPALSTSERLFAELSSDSAALQRFLVEGSQTFGAIAERRTDLTGLITNANATLQAIENRNADLDTILAEAPQTLRQANTTFVNLRAALDDLDPLIAASKPATRDLAPFLRKLRRFAEDSVPVFNDLSTVVAAPGPNNDLADTLGDLPGVQQSASVASPAAVRAMDDTQDNIALLRPYTPDLLSFLGNFGAVTANYDGNGHYARVHPTAQNIFAYNENGPAEDTLDPIYTQPEAQYDDIQFELFRRCPGGGAPPAPDGSNPFLDGGRLGLGDCDPSDVPPYP